MPCLVDLYQKVNLSVSLAVLRHQSVVYLVTLYGPGHSRAVLRTEVSAPAHCTAAGKALLAYCPVQADRYGRDLDLWPMTSHSITSQTAFTTELARIRAEGVAYDREEYVTGLVGVASPILRTTGRARAAIAVLGSTGQFDFEGVTRHLRRSGQYAAQLINRGALPHSDPVER
jgi:DNA-binding IclR family transcriptional regulator